jgi:hypothetical protein
LRWLETGKAQNYLQTQTLCSFPPMNI